MYMYIWNWQDIEHNAAMTNIALHSLYDQHRI